MVNILHGLMTKETVAVLPLHISRKIVLYQLPCTWSLIFRPQPLHSNVHFPCRLLQRHRILRTKLLNPECLKNRLILSFKNLFILSFTNICTKKSMRSSNMYPLYIPNIWVVSDCCLTPIYQISSFIMKRTR